MLYTAVYACFYQSCAPLVAYGNSRSSRPTNTRQHQRIQ